MLRLNTICHRAVDVARRPQPIAAIAVAATFAANEALLTIFGIAMTVAVALFLSAVAILLFRAALRVDDPAFERTVYLLKLVSVYGPRVLLARRSRQITEACVPACCRHRPRLPPFRAARSAASAAAGGNGDRGGGSRCANRRSSHRSSHAARARSNATAGAPRPRTRR